MLKHEAQTHLPQDQPAQAHGPATQEAAQRAAQARVTPEELAAAVARIEAQKAGGDGRIAIGEAVRELSLDATPEEILAEVQAGRGHAQTVKPRRRFSLRQRLGVYLAAGTVALGMTALVGVRSVSPAPDAGMVSVSPAANYSPPAAPQQIAVDPNLLVGDASGKLVLLSEVGDDQPVQCSYFGGAFQQYSPGASNTWTLIKHGGKVYARGWTLEMSPAVLTKNGADVSAVRDARFRVPLTLPVRGFTVSSIAGSDIEFHAQNIQLDQHAYEKW